MHRIRDHLLLAALLLLGVPVIGVEIHLVRTARLRAQRSQADLDLKKQERDRLARLSPAPSAENDQAIGNDLAEAEKILRSLQTAWLGDDATGAGAPIPAPITSIEAYFDLAGFVERTRMLAAQAQVHLKPAEYFGFRSYASRGPEPELVSAVNRQRVEMQHLLEALIAARPQALLVVQRERPVALGLQTGRARSAPSGENRAGPKDDGGQADDFFEVTGQISLRLAGQLDGDAFRLEFTGQTETLRALLNELASSSRLILVRSVEAEPLITDVQPVNPTAGTAVSAVPLVASGFSKFGVVVEYIVPSPATEGLAP